MMAFALATTSGLLSAGLNIFEDMLFKSTSLIDAILPIIESSSAPMGAELRTKVSLACLNIGLT